MPRVKVQALSTSWVKRATKPGSYSDGYGLTLRIDARGNKRWVQRLTIRGRHATWAWEHTPMYRLMKRGRWRWPTGEQPEKVGTP